MKYIKLNNNMSFTFLITKRVGNYKTKQKVKFYSRFTNNTFIGCNCHFNGMVIRDNGKVTIGDNFHSGKDILLINSYHRYDNADAIPYDTIQIVDKDITIEDNVWIGDRVLVLGGVSIGEGAIIQAGAVVVKDIEQFGIAGGNPAKVFKNRDIEGYNRIKKERSFV